MQVPELQTQGTVHISFLQLLIVRTEFYSGSSHFTDTALITSLLLDMISDDKTGV